VPEALRKVMAERAKRAAEEAAAGTGPKQPDLAQLLQSGQDRRAYPDAMRDWARHGSASRFVMTPEEVIAASRPRHAEQSEAAAHFELGNHLWRAGHREAAVRHFNESHRRQPENWTYKRQAWSLVGHERVGGELGRFAQSPLPGEEADWPFVSSFDADVAQLGPGEYYPNTM
jgi:hypothetical protein